MRQVELLNFLNFLALLQTLYAVRDRAEALASLHSYRDVPRGHVGLEQGDSGSGCTASRGGQGDGERVSGLRRRRRAHCGGAGREAGPEAGWTPAVPGVRRGPGGLPKGGSPISSPNPAIAPLSKALRRPHWRFSRSGPLFPRHEMPKRAENGLRSENRAPRIPPAGSPAAAPSRASAQPAAATLAATPPQGGPQGQPARGRPTAGQCSRVSPCCPVSPEQGPAAPLRRRSTPDSVRMELTLEEYHHRRAPSPVRAAGRNAGLIASRLFLCRPASVPRILRWRMHENIPTVPYQSPPGTLSCADYGFQKQHSCILVCQVTPRTA